MNLARSRFAYLFFALCTVLVPSSAQSHGGATPIPGRPRAAPPEAEPASGQLGTRPDGGLYVADEHQGGSAPAVRIVDLRWGRLVDVLGLAPDGTIDPRPILRDLAVGFDVVDNGVDYRLISSLATGKERLLILRVPGAPEPMMGAGTFEDLLLAAETNLSVVLPRDPADAPPFSAVPRNAVLVVRLDDLLEDGEEAAGQLYETVRLSTVLEGRPLNPRILFDPNHGGLRRGRFHSTRVLIDTTVGLLDAMEYPIPLVVNPLGLPEGPVTAEASVVLHIPTRVDPSVGTFAVLTNLRGRPLATVGNGPVDHDASTMDVVRAMRAGNRQDPFQGFLPDDRPPVLVGEFPLEVIAARPDPAGEPGFAFLVDLAFPGPCRLRPVQGNALLLSGPMLEVVENAGPGTPAGEVHDVRVRIQGRQSGSAADLVRSGFLVSPFRAAPFDPICWVRFVPDPAMSPGTHVSPSSVIVVRFSEAMDVHTVSSLDSLLLLRGTAPAPGPFDQVIADRTEDLLQQAFAIVPRLPLDHVQGTESVYRIELRPGPDGLTDLAGNPVGAVPSDLEFTLDPTAATSETGGVALSLASLDELPGEGAPDVRGNVFHDLGRGSLRPRPVVPFSITADRDKPTVSLMVPFAPGVHDPLNPLGSKLQAVWRYADLGWSVRDETKYDVDVTGLSWAPIGGLVLSDFYERFEIALAHSRFLPDEDVDNNLLPKYSGSGLRGRGNLFTDNLLVDPVSPQKVVHPRGLGYRVNSADLFFAQSGTRMMPFPLNRDPAVPTETYTWRDTSVRAVAGPSGRGIPMDIEVGFPLGLEPVAGEVAPAGQVPSIGLPLLVEYRCFPSSTALGLNSFDISLAINSSAWPAFRSYSAGGINNSGIAVVKDPDLEDMPSGGFNPSTNPPGGLTQNAHDNTFYIGQIDLATRVSRAHTVWIDTGSVSPSYVPVLVESMRPTGTNLHIEVRGADGFVGSQTDPFDAGALDAYGELAETQVQFHGGVSGWSTAANAIDGARYFQVRLTFEGDLDSGAIAELEGLGVAWFR